MDKVIKLRAGGVIDLANYVAKQLHNMFPSDGIKYDLAAMMEVLPRTLLRMRPILNSVRTFDPDIFNHFNSLQ